MFFFVLFEVFCCFVFFLWDFFLTESLTKRETFYSCLIYSNILFSVYAVRLLGTACFRELVFIH